MNKIFGNEKQQEIVCKKSHKNRKLDPSLLMNQSDTLSRMTLRRRSKTCQNLSFSSVTDHALIFPIESTYLPAINNDHHQDQGSPSNDNEEPNGKTPTNIFSISKTVVLFVAIFSFAGIICLCTYNKATLVVNAQHSINSGPRPGGNGYQNQPSNKQQSDWQPTTAFPHPRLDQPNYVKSSERRVRQHSIDRFDSGEQIRPPLLKQATTLPPLTKAQQASTSLSDGFNLQTSASQDSYLSPEDREQLMRSQHSHYEGKQGDQQLESAADRPSNRRNGQHQSAESVSNSELGASIKNQPDVSVSGGSSADSNDDGDYEDEGGSDQANKGANLVPTNRRLATGSASSMAASYNQRRQAEGLARGQRPTVDAGSAADEADSSDDYNANDEAYFSRKPSSSQERSRLNPAASYNQQQHHQQQIRGPPIGESQYGGGGIANEEQQADGGQGFGPGPNEAYMVDKAESGGKQGLEASDDDESLNYAPSSNEPNNDGSSQLSSVDEDSRFDRRSMNEPTRSGESSAGAEPYSAPVSAYGGQGKSQGGANNYYANDDSESDPEESGDSSEDSEARLVPASPPPEVKARASNVNQQRVASLVHKTSASAPAPLSAASPSSMKQQQFKKSQQAPFHGHQAAQSPPIYSSTNLNQASVSSSSGAKQERESANAPYNPQNNPSHAGKYFIN